MADLFISGVIQGNLTGDFPIAIELTVSDTVVGALDLSNYWIGSANDGNGSDGQEFQLSGTAIAGQKIYIANTGNLSTVEADEFVSFFGFAPTLVTPPFSPATAINGNDAIELFVNTGTEAIPVFEVVDTFGNPDGGAAAEGWEYTDGWAYRTAGTGEATFDINNWSFSGAGAMAGVVNNAIATSPFPIPTVYIIESDNSTEVSDSTNGITDTYDVVLSAAPTDDVVVTINPDDETDLGNGPGEPILLTFTAANFNQPQTVTVAAVEVPGGDSIREITHTVTSNDPNYDPSLNANNLIVNISNPSTTEASVTTVIPQEITTPGVTIIETDSSTTVSEGGSLTDTYEIFLDTQPTSDVTITLMTDGNTILDVTELIFTPDNFSEPQVVTVTAIANVMGNTSSTITHTATSGDTNYDSAGSLIIPDVIASILDSGITITALTPDPVVEGATTTYDIILNTVPTGDVTITVTPDAQTTIVGSATLNFSPSVLSQTVTVMAVDDGAGEGLHTGNISHAITTSNAVEYPTGLILDSVDVNINEPEISIIETNGGTTVSELGVSDTYTIALNSVPTDAMGNPISITITIDPDDQTSVNGAGVGAPVDLIFDASNLSQTVTVMANPDGIVEGTHTSDISHAVTASDSTDYPVGAIAGVTATVIDCFLTGTRLLTDKGEMLVEELQIGDRLQTFDGSLEPVKWIGIQTCYTHGNNHPLRTYPIRVKAGALGDNRPIRDLYVSPDHALFVEGLLINAGALENGESIVQTHPTDASFVYYHIELEHHRLVMAEGTPAESYLPQKQDRNTFDNSGEYVKLYPHSNMQALMPMRYPRVSSKRQLPRYIAKHLRQVATDCMLNLV